MATILRYFGTAKESAPNNSLERTGDSAAFAKENEKVGFDNGM